MAPEPAAVQPVRCNSLAPVEMQAVAKEIAKADAEVVELFEKAA